jgi:dimethylaniline monooxygenase (N-oxide forming)
MTGARKRVCVVGAGLSGLAAIRELTLAGHDVRCFEAGSAIGGMWRYENDNGVSAAYRSVSADTSWRRMQYPSLSLAGSSTEFPHHSELLAYLERYAEINDLFRRIAFGAPVERARSVEQGWEVTVVGCEPRMFDALVVASGHYWDPATPSLTGAFDGEILHARDYRTPDRFVNRSVVVVGAGQSALDIAAEVSGSAAHTILSCREGHHLIPRHVFGRPFDELDSPAALMLPLPVVRSLARAVTWAARATPDRGELPRACHPMFEGRWPVGVAPSTQQALRARAFACRPALDRLDSEFVAFTDGTKARADTIIFATGYQINFPFLPAPLGRGDGWQFPLYRRIVSPHTEGLAFIGILEPGPGLLAIVERQAAWLGEVLAERLPLPGRKEMWRAIDGGGERRSRRQFSATGPHTLLCNRHAYLKILNRDLRRVRRRQSLRSRLKRGAAPSPRSLVVRDEHLEDSHDTPPLAQRSTAPDL